MIQPNTCLNLTTSPRLQHLQRKYRDLALGVIHQAEPIPLQTATYVPSYGSGIAFERPIARVGSVLLCTLNRDGSSERAVSEPYLSYRGYRARYVPRTGEVAWDLEDGWYDLRVCPQTYATDHDAELMQSSKSLDILIGLADLANRTNPSRLRIGQRLMFPPTLLGFSTANTDLEEQLSAVPTQWVRRYAERNNLTTEQAWRELDQQTRLTDDIGMVGLRLVDARLCVDASVGSAHLPVILSTFHDLRRALGRRYSNPARKLQGLLMCNPAAKVIEEVDEYGARSCDPTQWNDGKTKHAIALMREHMGAKHVFYTDEDIHVALLNPNEPARVAKLNRERVICDHGEATVAHGLRRLLSLHISNGCSDQDLIRAYTQPEEALMAGQIAKRQVW